MTTAPDCLRAARTLMLAHLDIHPTGSYPADLDPAEVGIVGDTQHAAQGDSYHLGLPEQRRTGYSVSESPRDAALTTHARAIDWGWFSIRVAGKSHDLRSFSIWLVAQCKANTPDTRDIREVIYSPDGKVVRRWDRLGRRTSGDDSHETHTHVSYHSDAIKAGREQAALYRRYLREIGLLAGEDDDEMDKAQNDALSVAWQSADALLDMDETAPGGSRPMKFVREFNALRQDVTELLDRPTSEPAPIDYDRLAEALLRKVAAQQGG